MALLSGTLSQEVVLRIYTMDSTARCKLGNMSCREHALHDDRWLKAHPIAPHAAPDDYQLVNTTLTFSGDTSRIVIPVTVVDDVIDEENEEQLLARLRLEPVEGDLPNVQVDPAQATLIIEDDDSKMS